MGNRRLINLQVSGQESTPILSRQKTYYSVPLFDYSAPVASASPNTKTTTASRKRAISARQRAATRIVRDKFGDNYIEMTCSHFTTPSAQQMYKQHATRGRYFCESCGSWKDRKPKPARPVYPDEPPF